MPPKKKQQLITKSTINRSDIIAHRFGTNDVVQDELEQYLKAPPLAVSIQEANLSFDLIAWWRAKRNDISDIGEDGVWAVLYPFDVSWGWEGFQQVLRWNHILTSSAKLTLRDRRNRLLTESVESVECLHNWLLSGLIDGVLTQMDVSALMDLDEWAKKRRFSGVDVARWKCWFNMWFWWFR